MIPSALRLGLWSGVVLLALIGVGAALGRGAFPADLLTRVDPLRGELMRSFHREDPLALERVEEVSRFDGRFAAHPFLALLHVLPGGAFLTLAPFQFSSRVRSRYIRFHRWSGRALVLTAFIAVLPGFYFGLLMPYGGAGEALAIALFGGLFLATLSLAFVAIRRKEVARHREWMIRAFAVGIGISTVRVVGAVLDFAFTPAGFRPREMFVVSVWVGWLLTVAAAEVWIRYTRRPNVQGLRG